MKIIYSNRRTIAIIINNMGEVVVRAPRFVSKRQIMKFVNEKENWIQKKCSQVKKPAELSLVARAAYMFPQEPYSKEKMIKWSKDSASKIIIKRVEHYVNQVGVLPKGYFHKDIRMSNAKTRWGSCSGENNLNFSWKLALCPEYVLDYVVVHELCHIVHKNHGPHFWNMVIQYVPELQKAKHWLKINRTLLSFM